MFIDGIGISGYRSFGKEVQRIGPFKKINLIIGQNNSGKSNVLRFLKVHYPNIVKGNPPKLDPLDMHMGESTNEQRYEVAVTIDSIVYKKIIEKLAQSKGNFNEIINEIRKIYTSEILTTTGTTIAWFPCVVTRNHIEIDKNILQKFRQANLFRDNVWYKIWTTLTGKEHGDILNHLIPETIRTLSPLYKSEVRISFIPAKREIVNGSAGSSDELMSGKGLVKEIAKLENPRYNQPENKVKFNKINHFLQTVTGNKTAIIEIPSEQDLIQVSMNGRTLPLSSLGTGIHEVIILASAATILQNQILCIEEPEIHLHPLLQKQLLNYLSENTNNQYFIATHSAHILDMPDVAIFHIRLEGGKSVVDLALTDSQKSRICDELGYKASDLLQANCIIWVEGPSDRIYINHWIRSKAKDLIEGVHYSIMFYGGRLLSHLSGNEESIEDFIELRHLNRHMGIVIDSDKKTEDDDINETKKRIQKEFEDTSDFVWITQGKEIENYLKPEFIKEVIIDLHGDNVEIVEYSKYENCIKFKKIGEEKYKVADKVKLASRISEKEVYFDVLDLNEKITFLIQYIRESNGMKN